MDDVIPTSKLEYIHATLPKSGMITINRWSIFHRGYTIDKFDTKKFNTLKDAFMKLPDNPEAFVMAFTENGGCETMWFTEKQKEKGLLERLNMWRSCYGKYSYSIYKKA
jgi:hypothetical protein